MTPDSRIMQAVERLGYRVTIGDVATQAGLDVNFAQQGLLTLASEVGGHLQVAESGDIVYLFPQEFRSILRNKYFRLQLQEWWGRIWKVLFYLIRISFGIVLLASILVIGLAIAALTIAAAAAQGDDRDGGFSIPSFSLPLDWWWFFDWGYHDDRRYRSNRPREAASMNFFEAVFSFLFGDGNPNTDLDDRRWRTIGQLIRNQRGAVVAEQVAPFLDDLGSTSAQASEDYILPVLVRFNGRPEVSETGDLIYHFPELQTLAKEQTERSLPQYLEEARWVFSQATSTQKLWAIGLGGINLVGALALGSLLRKAAVLGGFLGFVQSIYVILLIYGVAFLVIPFVRNLWIQSLNQQIAARNSQRQRHSRQLLTPDSRLLEKLNFAQQFAGETVISDRDLAYTTEDDLVAQEAAQPDKIDAEWQQRLLRNQE